MERKKNQWKFDKKFYGFIEIILIFMIFLSLWKISNYLIDGKKSKDFSENLSQMVIMTDAETEEEVTAKLQSEKEEEETTQEEVIKIEETILIEEMGIPEAIDFGKLQEISQDAVAWLHVPNGVMDNVVAQSQDNDDYLHRLLDGTYANGGTLFIDCRNKSDFSDWNTIIYGHNMKNGTMFAFLLNYQDQTYYEENPVMYLYTPQHRFRVELIAGYLTKTDDKIYSILNTKQDRDRAFYYAKERSTFISQVSVDEEDRLVTFSTCAYAFENARYIVIGKLVED